MTTAACDVEAFNPLHWLVSGPFTDLTDLSVIEEFVRTVVLHDEIVNVPQPLPQSDDDLGLPEEEEAVGGRMVITALGPVLDGYDFFMDRRLALPVPDIELSPALLAVAAEFANAGEGNVYFTAHVQYLKRMLGIVEQGGSALLYNNFGKEAISVAQRYPKELFRELDADWQRHARRLQRDGLRLVVPPVLAIVLTRAARRDAIPAILRDLRDEWAYARQKVWNLLNALRKSPTLAEAWKSKRSCRRRLGYSRPKQRNWILVRAGFCGSSPRRCHWCRNGEDFWDQTCSGSSNRRGSTSSPIGRSSGAKIR